MKSSLLKLEYQLAELIYDFYDILVSTVQRLFFSTKLIDRPKMILIYRTGHLGDTICSIPALRAVEKRFPDAYKIFMTNETDGTLAPKSILNGILQFNEFFTFDPKQTYTRFKNFKYLQIVIRNLRAKKIDLLIYMAPSNATFYHLLRDMIFFRLAGCKSAIGFKITLHRFFRRAQTIFKKFDSEVVRLMKLIVRIDVPSEIRWELPRVSIPLELNPDFPVIAVHPWSHFPENRWPLERFAEVTRFLQQKYKSRIILIGGIAATADSKTLNRRLFSNIIDLTGKTSILQTAEILRKSRLLISTDSGPAHIAAAVGTPVVGIYSSREYPNIWYPYGNRHQILRSDSLIDEISAEKVIAACERLL